jgi:hypothetical protein
MVNDLTDVIKELKVTWVYMGLGQKEEVWVH